MYSLAHVSSFNFTLSFPVYRCLAATFCLCTTCTQCPRSQEKAGPPGTGVTDGCEQKPCGYRKSNLSRLEELPVLLSYSPNPVFFLKIFLDFLILSYVHDCFVCMYICLPGVCLLPAEVRRGFKWDDKESKRTVKSRTESRQKSPTAQGWCPERWGVLFQDWLLAMHIGFIQFCTLNKEFFVLLFSCNTFACSYNSFIPVATFLL